MRGNHNMQGALLALAAMGIYATHDVVVKYLGGSFSAVQIVFFSSLLSFPLVTIFILQDRSGGSLWPRHPGWVALRTVSAIVTSVCAFYAFGVLPLAQTYALLFAIPLIITILSIPVLGEKVRLRRWSAVIVGLLGVLIVLSRARPHCPPAIWRRWWPRLPGHWPQSSFARWAPMNGPSFWSSIRSLRTSW